MYATTSDPLSSSALAEAPKELTTQILGVFAEILALIAAFRSSEITPQATANFETQLQSLLRELGRRIVEWTLNSLEPADASLLPREFEYGNEFYRRGKRSPRRYEIKTLFGAIRLIRFMYRPWTPGEPCLFPLEINLGIEPGGATPALALRVGEYAAELTQQQTLGRLKDDHGVTFSVEALRKLTAAVAEGLTGYRHEVQVARLLELLDQANKSTGSRKIVMSVGRDGVFAPIRKCRAYMEAAAATVAVYDRRGARLGTIYLGRMPEPGQGTMSEQLTRLLRDVLERWEGPMPRLAYVTDAGWHPSAYFKETLQPMRHPRTDKPLQWEWVVDYFHVCNYVTKLAEAIFGEGREASTWARKMRRWLKEKPNGAYRVLHSAAALKDKRGLVGSAKQFATAYGYLRDRLEHLDYVDCRRRGLPIGSGVTEAACKIVVTWRLKQSGMAWDVAGGQTILDLRVLRLSGVWQSACGAYLADRPTIARYTPTEPKNTTPRLKIAA